MAGGVRLTKDEREMVEYALTSVETAVAAGVKLKAAQLRAIASLRDKLLRSELVKGKGRASGIGFQRAAEAMREVLGANLALPPRPDDTWCIRIATRIRDLGLTEEDCKVIARGAVQHYYRPPYDFEKLIWDASKLLALGIRVTVTPGSPPDVQPEKKPLGMEGW